MRLLTICTLLVVALPAHAARPMITDDARITDPGACQVETWFQRFRDATDWWALPACNPGGNFEVTAGGAHAHAEGEAQRSAFLVQGKTLFKPLETDGWGIGLAAGYATQPGGGSGSGAPYFYVPVSLSFAADRILIHGNLGATRLRVSGDTRFTWGIGGEFALTDRIYAIAESFGQDRGGGLYQGGVRVWLVPAHVQIDATVGSSYNDSREDRWFSLGLRLISPRLF
jgi:hypothetical protein